MPDALHDHTHKLKLHIYVQSFGAKEPFQERLWGIFRRSVLSFEDVYKKLTNLQLKFDLPRYFCLKHQKSKNMSQYHWLDFSILDLTYVRPFIGFFPWNVVQRILSKAQYSTPKSNNSIKQHFLGKTEILFTLFNKYCRCRFS